MCTCQLACAKFYELERHCHYLLPAVIGRQLVRLRHGAEATEQLRRRSYKAAALTRERRAALMTNRVWTRLTLTAHQ